MRRPYLSSFVDRHGRARWRFRRGKEARYLPGAPGDAAFEAAYRAALAGEDAPAPTAEIVPFRGVAARSLEHAWRLVEQSAEWSRLRPISREQQSGVARRFLASPVAPGAAECWGAMPLPDLRRRHVKAILAERADTPHAATMVLKLLRKLVLVGLDEEWIETDPTHRVGWRPAMIGHRAWTTDERGAFEARWPMGTTPRLVYALALYTGLRREDLTRLRWSDLRDGRVTVDTSKTGAPVRVRILAPVAAELAVAARRGPTVLTRPDGGARSAKALTEDMRAWTAAAGLPPGCRLHGLRTTFAEMLDAAQAPRRGMQRALGHASARTTEHYTRGTDLAALTDEAMCALDTYLRRTG